MYEIVIHRMSIAVLDVSDMIDVKAIERLEIQNNMKTRTIVKITPLR